MTPDDDRTDDKLTDDALLTAYALGEVDDTENARVEALLAADPDARRAVEEARATAADLEQLFADEPAPELAPEQRERIAVASARRRVTALRPLLAVAASLVAAVGVAALGTADRGASQPVLESARLDPRSKGGSLELEEGFLLGGAATTFPPVELAADSHLLDGVRDASELTTATWEDQVHNAASATRTIAGGTGADGSMTPKVEFDNVFLGGSGDRGQDRAGGPGHTGAGSGGTLDPLVGGSAGGSGATADPAKPNRFVATGAGERLLKDTGIDVRGLGSVSTELGLRRIRHSVGRDFSTVFKSLRLPPADGKDPSPQVVAEVWRRLREVNPDVSYDVAVAAIERARASAQPGSEAYEPIGESRFREPAREPLSTFSIDVDTASYSNVRRFLEAGQLPPPDAVRLEELVNYFSYDDPTPDPELDEGHPFATRVEIAGCPWNTAHRLVRIGLRAKDVGGDLPALNVVFLIDVSGSMQSDDKLPLLKRGMKLLAGQMREQDRVGIVTYASNSGVALRSTTGAERSTITGCIDALSAGGSTNGGAGIQQAYEMARRHFVKGGVNRVVLATDGDFNVGVTDKSDLVKLIQKEAESGVFLTVLGFGTGNIKDATLEQIADKGNGQYAYIDGLREARRVLVERMRGTLVTVAKDVKIQVEFNPARVASYRLLGYENRVLAAADFNDDAKDAGEIGSGHSVTALYEVVPVGAPPAHGVDELRYQPRRPVQADDVASDELLAVKLRYKQPDGAESTKIEIPVTDAGQTYAQASDDMKFAASVAMFGMLLRNSPTRGTASYEAILELGGEALGEDPRGYRAQFLDLVLKAKTLSGR